MKTIGKEIKATVLGLLGAAVLIMSGVIGGTIESTYTMECVVTEVSEGVIIITDTEDEKWAFKGDGYEQGDKVKAWFFTNGTDFTRYDDEVKRVRKE